MYGNRQNEKKRQTRGQPMITSVFEFLNSVGLSHFLHPALVCVPAGLISGALVFRVAAFVPRFRVLARTGYHCMGLALAATLFAALTGYLDWQFSFAGAWTFPLVLKMALAAILIVLLIMVMAKDDPEHPGFNRSTFFYFLAVLLVIGLGSLGSGF